jgi:hypothetical protein
MGVLSAADMPCPMNARGAFAARSQSRKSSAPRLQCDALSRKRQISANCETPN